MPLFLIHGFRWSREEIRIHTITKDLFSVAPDYLMSSSTPDILLSNLRTLYPTILRHLPQLTFVEQYDPADLHTGTHPYAYVADKVVRADLNIDITEVMSQSLGVKAWDAMADLRDKLEPKEKVGWYVVYNGDPERADVGSSEEEDEESTEEEAEEEEIEEKQRNVKAEGKKLAFRQRSASSGKVSVQSQSSSSGQSET